MRLCRYRYNKKVYLGLYDERRLMALADAAARYQDATHNKVELPESDSLIDFLPPNGRGAPAATAIAEWWSRNLDAPGSIATESAELLVPFPRPNKLFLLAGNYAEHIEESGGVAAARSETFPYVFMKPPTTTLTDPGKPVVIPKFSPGAIDWELELAVVIGRRCKAVRDLDALDYVAGYTVINDISNRKFRPNPDRKTREKDGFFDWLHGKWHDSFCPCGPCVVSADAVPNPQDLKMELRLNGQVKQDSSTRMQIFPVAAVIEFISAITTLEPGDLISTGTPSGVGNASGVYLKPGDRLEASIERIGTLVSPVVAEDAR